VASTTESSQEWVSLSKPDEPQSPNTQPEFTSHEHPQPQETPLEFSSSTLIDVPDALHESTTTIASSAPSTPDPDTHHAPQVHIRSSDTEKQAEPTVVEFVPASEILKPRASTPSLYDSHRLTAGGTSTSELSTKKKRGGSFIKKSGTLINKVFKNKDASTSNESNQPLASSSPDLSEPAPGHDSADNLKKKLTSPSRVSLGSIRSISGSIKKKMGKSSTANDSTRDPVVSGAREDGSPLPVNSNSEEVEQSLLKSMFKVRKPSK